MSHVKKFSSISTLRMIHKRDRNLPKLNLKTILNTQKSFEDHPNTVSMLRQLSLNAIIRVFQMTLCFWDQSKSC